MGSRRRFRKATGISPRQGVKPYTARLASATASARARVEVLVPLLMLAMDLNFQKC